MFQLSCLLVSMTGAGAPLPLTVELMERTKIYQARPEREDRWFGIIRNAKSVRTPPGKLKDQDKNQVRHTYTLEVFPGPGEKTTYLPLYAPGSTQQLERFLGQRVWMFGKLVRSENDVDRVEIWAGQLEPFDRRAKVVDKEGKQKRPDAVGVYGRCNWRPLTIRKDRTPQVQVYRSGTELAAAMGLKGPSADSMATTQLARRMGVAEIDWTKQMVVTVVYNMTSGRSDTPVITRITRDKTMTIYHRLPLAPEDGAVWVGTPAVAVLIDRFDGPIRHVAEAIKSKERENETQPEQLDKPERPKSPESLEKPERPPDRNYPQTEKGG